MASLTQSSRLVFLDVLRLIAAVQMIQGHCVSAVLAPEYRRGFAYALWTFARGLTSVLFLTTAGLAFVLAEQRAASASARKRRSLRALRLLAIGYAMHVPYAALLAGDRSALTSALVVDVLQCIGASLLLLELLTVSVTCRELRVWIGAGLALLCFGLAPFAQGLAVEGSAAPFAQYLTSRHGSLFPLLPWSGYVFAGFALGALSFGGERLARPAFWLSLSAGLALLVGLAALAFERDLPRAVSPGFAAVKLGCVLALAALLSRAFGEVRALPPLLASLAAETLFLYVSHVVILYADGLGLAARIGQSQSPAVGAALALALLLASCAGALGFRHVVRSLRGGKSGSTRAAELP